MATLYKLVTQNYLTREGEDNETDWLQPQPPKTELLDPQMCSEDVYHAYAHPDLAFLLNPLHAGIKNPRILKCSGEIVVSDFGKVGTFDLEVLEEIEKPEWVGSDYELDVRVWFAVLCAESVLHIWESYNSNNENPKKAVLATKTYLKNKSKINSDAYSDAAYAAYAACTADAYTAARDAADAAYAAARDAAYAAYAARTADAAYAARAAANAAYAACTADAYTAARAAVYAAYAADAAYANINFVLLAEKAVEMAKEG